MLITHKIGNNWQGIPPQVIDDDLYYYARITDVAKGHPFLGNPYFLEYSGAMAPAFFLPDWINAAPLLLGLPLIPTIILNFLLWSVIFTILIYLIARQFDLSPPASAIAAIVSFLETYWLMMRPVAMQVIFPSFLLFLLALILWLKQKDNRSRQIFLIIASALTFYLYAYLWQIVCIILGLLFIYFLFQKQIKTARQLFVIFIGTIVLSIPAIIYTVKQIQAPFYWQTIARIGLISTHLPAYYAYQYGRWVIIVLAAYFLVWWVEVRHHEVRPRPEIIALIFSGLGLLIMSVSNLLTGKELETALHTGRFITLWVPMFFTILIFRWWKEKTLFSRSNWQGSALFIKVCICILILLTAGFLVSNLNRSLPWSQISRTDFKPYQEYAAPFDWLNQNASSSNVIWANENISTYLPVMTRDYVFWDHLGTLHLMPSREVEDRFLLSWIGTSTSAADLIGDYRSYDGAGPVWKYTDLYYKNRLGCDFKLSCAPDKTLAQWIGIGFIKDLEARQAILKSNLKENLKKYSVSYAVADKSLDEDKYFDTLPFLKQVWHNQRFVIYKVK